MLKYLNRIYTRFQAQVNTAAALLVFFTIFHKPLKLIFVESQQEDYITKDPRRAQLANEFEDRKAKIQKLVKDIDEARDNPELQKDLKEQLRLIHVERYRRFQAIAHSPRPELNATEHQK